MTAPLDLKDTRNLTAANNAPAREPDVWDERIDNFNPLFGRTPEAEPIQESPSFAAQAETFSVEEYLAAERTKDLLRFSTAGSVDDGKSTLIGRLLYDTQSVYDDQLKSIEGKGTTAPGVLDLALLTDGLRAEREQGITIDVAYRYFTTERRKFIIADTPGHEQYTRNMATGASTASVAIVLVDARKGVLIQSRRHAAITTLLGVPHIVVAVNKMDLVSYDEPTFRAIEQDFRAFFTSLEQEFGHTPHLHFLPVSALEGDNVVTRSQQTPWYSGPSLLQLLENIPAAATAATAPFRFAVQRVLRPNLDFRGFAGQIASGTIAPRDTVRILPSGRETTVARIVTFTGDLPQAHAPQSVTLTLADEVDLSRGDLLVTPDQAPAPATRFTATLVWMDAAPLDLSARYLLKHTSRTVTAQVASLTYRLDPTTLRRLPNEPLTLNSIGTVQIESTQPLVLDPYSTNRITGSFVLIDPQTNATVAAGMVRSLPRQASATSTPAPAAPQFDRSINIETATDATATTQPVITPEQRIAAWGHTSAHIHLSGDAPFFDETEAALFHASTFIARPQSPSAAAVAALLDAGAIVLTTSAATTRSTVVDNRLLSITTTYALLDHLRTAGILKGSNA